MNAGAVAPRPCTSSGSPPLRTHAPFFVAAFVCTLVFGWMLTYGTGRWLEEDSFGNFYDYQAQAWLKGRWDVPEPALGGEAFVVDGRIYGYFGPTPALLRLPFAIVGIGFGKLTRTFMLFEYLVALVGAYSLLRAAAHDCGTRASGATTAIFTTATGLGSTLFFLSSRAYVYHEAILCGAALALWSVWFSLTHFRQPTTRSWVGALICGILAVQARPPIGLFALTLLGLVALARACRERRIGPVALAVAAAAGIASYGAVSYVKFGTFEGCPLRYNVQYDAAKIAALDGRNFHVSNLRFNTDSYFAVPSASLRPTFPYVYLEYLNRTRDYPESKIAYRDPTLAVPYAMPALTLLALCGGLILRSPGTHRKPVLLLAAAAIPVLLAMLTAVAVTQRYTADFCPWLIAMAAYGAVGTGRYFPGAHKLISAAIAAAVLVSIALQFAITLHHQRAVVWGVPAAAQSEYQDWQRRIDGWFRTREHVDSRG